MRKTIDIETNMAHDIVWCVVTEDQDSGEIVAYASDWTGVNVTDVTLRSFDDLAADLDGVDLVGHNGVGFDFPKLSEVLGVTIPRERQHDTLIRSRMWNTNVDGGHSLKAWGGRLGGAGKLDYDDHDAPLDSEKLVYCIRDVKLTTRLDHYLHRAMDEMGFSDESVELERDVAYYTHRQERNGFYFDIESAQRLYATLIQRQGEIETELQEVFPPIVIERYSDKTGKQLKDKVEVFNPGSRIQIAKRLESKGVVWTKFTEKGNVIVDETTLGGHTDIPEAAAMLEYLKTGKLASMVKGWLDHYNPETHRIHGRVNTVGAVTGRMTHSSPNVAQVDKDKRSRSCWTVPEGRKLVGADASGLELRMFAHYLQDEDYTSLILDGDIHTYNQEAAGLPTRNDAKTFIYAMLYGAGLGKIGSIVGGSVNRGRELKENFINSVPAYEELVDKIERISQQGHLPGLDGRRIRVRHAHAALNTLLQGGGAIVMKKAMVLACQELDRINVPYKLVAQVHDEMQVETEAAYADEVGQILVQAIRDAGDAYGMRCPLDGEYDVGDNWSETH